MLRSESWCPKEAQVFSLRCGVGDLLRSGGRRSAARKPVFSWLWLCTGYVWLWRAVCSPTSEAICSQKEQGFSLLGPGLACLGFSGSLLPKGRTAQAWCRCLCVPCAGPRGLAGVESLSPAAPPLYTSGIRGWKSEEKQLGAWPITLTFLRQKIGKWKYRKAF